MRLSDPFRGEKRNSTVYIIMMILLMGGITAGSVYLAKHSIDMGEGIQGYITNLFMGFADNTNNLTVFKNTFVSNLIMLLVIFIMGFFRFGFVVTGAIIIRKGFIMGFTAASFFEYYGIKGMLVMLSSMPTIIITIPALLLFSAVSVIFSLNQEKNKKNLIISYIFFLVFVISIFCVASLSEGYLTTTFMKLLAPKIIQ